MRRGPIALARPELIPYRVAGEERGRWRLTRDGSELVLAEATGRLRHLALSRPDLPVTGDWVLAVPHAGGALIHSVLERRSLLSRRAAGTSGESQPLAANVDLGLIVTSLNSDLNPRRIERYVTLCWNGGVTPLIVLSKTDLRGEAEAQAAIEELGQASGGAEVLPVSALSGAGIAALRERLGPGRTAVLLGSSGVGKSSLVNALLGREALDTGAIREADDRGRHTTTSRHLLLLPEEGGVIIDTPGMRELQLEDGAEAGLSEAFAEIAELAGACRFGDCAHEAEPGCAVRAAIADGSLPEGRYAGWLKLQRELAYQRRKEDPAEQRAERDRWKRIHKEMRRNPKRGRWDQD